MCLIGLRFDETGECFIAANRDEFADRPTEPLQWWDEGFLAGRDLQAGGSWLGVTRSGRFAAITNVRDPSLKESTKESAKPAKSRGLLVTGYLAGLVSPEDYLQELKAGLFEPAPFNLLVGELTPNPKLWWLGGRVREIQALPLGSHVLSNAELNTPWPKASALKGALDQHLARDPEIKTSVARWLTNTTTADDKLLPQTGVSVEWERRLSAAKILGHDYHTRSTTLMHIVDGQVHVEETSWSPSGEASHRVTERFLITPDVGLRPFGSTQR
jgi:uncharacterized protein with NRDE domain